MIVPDVSMEEKIMENKEIILLPGDIFYMDDRRYLVHRVVESKEGEFLYSCEVSRVQDIGQEGKYEVIETFYKKFTASDLPVHAIDRSGYHRIRVMKAILSQERPEDIMILPGDTLEYIQGKEQLKGRVVALRLRRKLSDPKDMSDDLIYNIRLEFQVCNLLDEIEAVESNIVCVNKGSTRISLLPQKISPISPCPLYDECIYKCGTCKYAVKP
jgi:hypothetical protein